MHYNAKFKDFNPDGYSCQNTLIVTIGEHTLHLWFENETIGEIIHYFPTVDAAHETIMSLESTEGFFLDAGAKIIGLQKLLDDVSMNYRDFYNEEKNQ